MSRSDFYNSYIVSEEWRKKARERMEIDGYKCVMCGRPSERTRHGLQVHHITYRNLGNEDAYNELVTLCSSCHIKIHNYLNRTKKKAARGDDAASSPQ